MRLPSCPAWIKRVLAVLARRGVVADDLHAIAQALHEAPADPRLRAMLDGDPPPTPAVIAPFDGTLRVVDGRISFAYDDGTLSDWQYRLDPALLRVAPGSRVHAGQQLTDGDVYDALWIEVFGEEGAVPLRAKLMALTGLDPRLADLVLAPMLDGVSVEPEGRRPGDRLFEMSRERFEGELGARLAAGISALPVGRRVLLGYRKLARMDDQGQVFPGPLRALGSFTVTRRRLSVGDASSVVRRPEREPGLTRQHKFGALEGPWRAQAVLTPNRRRVSELWVWHHTARPWLGRTMWACDLEVTSGRVLVCDLTRSVWNDPSALSTHCAQQVGGGAGWLAARVSLPEVEGVVCAAPARAGRYRVYVQYGAGDYAEALCVRFHDDPVL